MDSYYYHGELSRGRSVKPLAMKFTGGAEGFDSPAPRHRLLLAL